MPVHSFPRTTHAEVECRLLLFIAMAQAASSPPRGRIDLTIPKTCETRGSAKDDVIVCGRRRDDSTRYRIPPSTPTQSDLPKAELILGNGTRLSAETEQVDIGGMPSNRAMIRLRFKF